MPANSPTIVFAHGAWADATGFDGSIRGRQGRPGHKCRLQTASDVCGIGAVFEAADYSSSVVVSPKPG
jgi:hypothetical protein